MKSLIRMLGCAAIVCAILAAPANAQIANGLTFSTSFPFYVGNAKMPAGEYRVTQSDVDDSVLLIQSSDSSHAAFIDYIPTHAAVAHQQSDATFHTYGGVEYLNRVWVGGQKFGMKVEQTKAEKRLATKGAPKEHSISGRSL